MLKVRPSTWGLRKSSTSLLAISVRDPFPDTIGLPRVFFVSLCILGSAYRVGVRGALTLRNSQVFLVIKPL